MKHHLARLDAIRIAEAQDLPSVFLRIGQTFLKLEKRLVFAYDGLQNLSFRPMLPAEEICSKKLTEHLGPL